MKITLEGTWQEIREQIKEMADEKVSEPAVNVQDLGTMQSTPASVPVTTMQPQTVPTAAPVAGSVPLNTQQQAVPTENITYSMDDLTRAAMPLADSGRTMALQNLLRTFGVRSLPELPQEQYGAFATALRGLGAKI